MSTRFPVEARAATAATRFAAAQDAHAVGRLDTAEALYRELIAHDPAHAGALHYCGIARHQLGDHAGALALMDRALRLAPADPNLWNNRGLAANALGRAEEAIRCLHEALRLNPAFAHAHNNLGITLVDLSRLDEAQAAFTRAIELNPDFASAHSNLGNTHRHAGSIEAAIACYRRAVACPSSHIGVHSNLVYALMFATDDGHAVRAAAEQLSARYEAALLAASAAAAHPNTPDPARRLRIGYVSPDFRNHCQALFTTPLLRHHDPESFKIFCYSLTARPDDVTARLASLTHVWRDVRDFDDARLAQQIREDRIDILVDLTLHMDGARRLLYARRPAPVQVAWLAYPGTTGSPAIGWRLTDAWLDPLDAPQVDAQYTERSLRLPDAFWCYDALAPGIEVGALPALGAGHLTFGCLNHPCKLTEATLALWSGVFAALPDARLVLMAPEGAARARLATRLAAHGIGRERVRFVGFQPRVDYLRTYGQIDIALETLPYNGHTTSLDAFWMGVPVPTKAGRAAVGRAGLSLLANLGLPQLVAHDDAHYVAIVTALARDLPRLAALRAGLRARMQASPLMNGARFARHFETACRHMWADWCARV